MKTALLGWTLAACLALTPRLAASQCMGGMTGGEHQHAEKAVKEDKKTSRAIAKLLAEDSSRDMLLEAIVADARFMRLFIARLAAMPEWRSLAAERLNPTPLGGPAADADSAAIQGAKSAEEPATIYRCPMHPEVTSGKPGTCPKCGMTLQPSG